MKSTMYAPTTIGDVPEIKPALIIFDWDNTLVDSWDVIHNAMMATFKKLDIPSPWETKEETMVAGQESLRNYFPLFFGDQYQEARDIYYAEYRKHNLDYVRIMKGANNVLEKLSKKNIAMAVISNKEHESLLMEAKHLGLDKYFKAMVGAGIADNDKPHIEVFDYLMKQMYKEDEIPDREKIWYVGDMNVDVTFANNCSIISLLIPTQPFDKTPNYQLDKLEDVLKFAGV